MDQQQFGTIETTFGNASAMLCVDSDCPMEFMIHWWGDGIQSGAILLVVAQCSQRH